MSDDVHDITDRVRKTWSLPAGWSVTATEQHDDRSTPDDADCYSPLDIAAWRADEWHYVGITVSVCDGGGREWGESSLWSLEKGLALTDDRGDLTGKYADPIHDDYPLDEMIPDAMEKAASALAAFVANMLPSIRKLSPA